MLDQYPNFDIETLIKAMQEQQTPQYGQPTKFQDAPLANNIRPAATPSIGVMPSSFTEQQHQNNLGTWLQMAGVGQPDQKKDDKTTKDNTDLFDDISTPTKSENIPLAGMPSYTENQHKNSMLGIILQMMTGVGGGGGGAK